jgi:hypothetical protein
VLEDGIVVTLRSVVLRVGVAERLDPCHDADARGGAESAGVGEGTVGRELEVETCVCARGGGDLMSQVEGGRECRGLDEL